jgi:tetratricopeptide (TPR) repeat protein
MKRRPHTLTLGISLLSLLLLCTCTSAPPEIEPGLQPREYFQRAQDASEADKYKLAVYYYEAFLEAYPEERDRGLWAEYEIALLYEKMGELKQSLRLCDALLARYLSADAQDYPPGPQILAEKVKARIEAALGEE